MKKLDSTIIILALFTLAVYGSVLAISHKLDAEAENAILQYKSAISDYKIVNGRYPNSLHEIEIKRENIYPFVDPSEIKYIKGDTVELYYTQFPLGPKHVYNLKQKAWRYEE